MLLLAALCLPLGLQAQSEPQRRPPAPLSRVDLFGGYAYFHPYSGAIGGYAYQPIQAGAVTSLSVYFTRFVGAQVEGGFHPDGPNDCVYSAQAGPIARLPRGRWVGFAHLLGGGTKIGGPVFQPCSWGWGVTSGVGVDYVLPGWDGRAALRLVQADWQYSHVSYGPLDPAGVAGGSADVKDYRLAAGLVLRLGSVRGPRAPLQVSCTLGDRIVYEGDPVRVSVEAANLDPKKTARYSWTSTGGRIAGSGAAATVDTRGLAVGGYVVTATVIEGNKPAQRASCDASFVLRAYDPPTVTCVANPSQVRPGEIAVITARAVSPQNRALSYAFSSSAGVLGDGGGNKTILGTGGVAVGTVTVTCKAADDLGKTASSSTEVTVGPPLPAPPTLTRSVCDLWFGRDRRRPVRVDNEAKGCLDDIALALVREPDARLVVVGHADSSEKAEAAALRALNVKSYLTQEKGIDPRRVELRVGQASGRTVDTMLVPAGAAFSAEDTSPVDESKLRGDVPRATRRR